MCTTDILVVFSAVFSPSSAFEVNLNEIVLWELISIGSQVRVFVPTGTVFVVEPEATFYSVTVCFSFL